MSRPAETSLLTANLICTASMVIWAAGLPAADHLIPLLTPVDLNAFRMGLAALFLVPVWAMWEGLEPLRRVNWKRGVAVGALFGLSAWFIIKGQAISGAIMAAVISSTMPVVGLALEVVLDGRRVTGALITGVLLSVVGGVLVLDGGSLGSSVGWGAIFCFGSVLCFTLGSRLTVTQFPDQTPLGRTAVTLTGAAVAAGAAALVQMALGAPLPDLSAWGWPEGMAMLLYAVGALGISQVLWIMSVGRLGIGLSALHINMAPFYVMLILFAMGGVWDWSQAGAAALVGLGVLIAQGVVSLPFGART